MPSHPKECEFQTNGRRYRCPGKPVVAICLDGSSDEYFDAALLRGLMPNLQRMCLEGTRALVRAAMPTFTNVNNSSIVTGVPPSVHGICGNFFFDVASGKEVMMNSAEFLRAETIFPAVAKAGRKVAVITAKEKLRDIFARGLIEKGGIAFSSERASQAQLQTHGIAAVEDLTEQETPQIYSGEASVYVLKAGAALLRKGMADFLYLSTTDYIQHKCSPEQDEALQFYRSIDLQLGELLAAGALVGLTADHGMNPKQRTDGSPHVFYLESYLNEQFASEFRVILPITDPYVVHHGALGSFAVIHSPPSIELRQVRESLVRLPGITEVYFREEAASKLELPKDRLGDLVVCAGRDLTLGRRPESHDLAVLKGPLRSHGGRYEEMVPLVISDKLSPDCQQELRCDPRNFDLFHFLLNGVSS